MADTQHHRYQGDWLLAGATAGAGLIHLAATLEHRGSDAMLPIAFAAVAWAQLTVAYLVVRARPSRDLLLTSAVVNAGAFGAWALSRTVGLPFGLHDGVPEPAARLDLVAVSLQAAAVVLAVAGLLGIRLARTVGMAGAGAALGLATVAMVVPDVTAPVITVSAAGNTSGGDGHGHSHGSSSETSTVDDHAAQMIAIDRARCDLAFNPQAYWDEALATGVDTYAGGDMTQGDHAGSAVTDVAGPIQLGGRGTQRFDELVGLASLSDGENAAAQLIVELSQATDAEYDAFRTWLREGQGTDHSHGSTATTATTVASSSAATQTNSPIQTMGHVGPHTWRAMVDEVACDRLADELAEARATALRYPTVADATAAGWVRVTGYVPGIAAHYMNFGLVDGEFEIDRPEMILYDGTEPDSRVIGLSYYIRLDGNAQPTQGFSGDNDHYHRHLGLCVGAGGVIGDSTTTPEECAAMGGAKAGGTDGWMSHAWVVPGCESPWGVFSAVNPLLDGALGDATGEQDSCAGSSVRSRYDLSAGATDLRSLPSTELAAGDD